LEFTTSQDIYAFLACLQHSFEYLGGVPKEILSDNMKTVVLRREDGKPVFHPTFLQFAAYYGFIPKPGIPYKARTRGKIENGIGFVKRDFYLGRETLPTSLLNKEAKIWIERVNNEVSAAHGEVVSERAKKENLLPLPQVPLEISRLYERKVDKTSLLSFEGNHYSVPYLFAGQRVLVKVKENRISVFFDGKTIAHHKLAFGRGKRVMDPAHYKKEDKNYRSNKGPQPIGQILKESFPLNLLLAGKYQFVEVEKRPLEFYENLARKEKE